MSVVLEKQIPIIYTFRDVLLPQKDGCHVARISGLPKKKEECWELGRERSIVSTEI